MSAWDVAAQVVDPELPMLTLADLGVLRSVRGSGDEVVVTLTPTYTGCPAMEVMRADVVRALARAGYDATVEVQLTPAWSSDWISPTGREALAAAGISPPGPAPTSTVVPLTLGPTRSVTCPRCGSAGELLSEFGATSCKAVYRCTSCAEPFEHVKEI